MAFLIWSRGDTVLLPRGNLPDSQSLGLTPQKYNLFPIQQAFLQKKVFLSLTTNFFPTFAGSFFGRVASSRRDDTIVTLDKRSAVGGNTNRQQQSNKITK